jgi:hypothetical protein
MMTYEYKYLTKQEKTDAIRTRQKINEADIYEFELHIAELNLAEIKEDGVIQEYTTRINDKISQNNMLDLLINQLG